MILLLFLSLLIILFMSLKFPSLQTHLSGEAEAILARAQATAKGITLVSQSLKENGGVEVRFFHHWHHVCV